MLRYDKKNTLLHRMDARLKLILLIAVNLALFASVDLMHVAVLSVVVLLAYAIARINPLRGMMDLGPAWVFAVLPLLLIFLFGEPVGKAVAIAVRIIFVLLSGVLFIYTTKQQEIARSLAYFKVPAAVALMLIMAFRFIPVLQQEVHRVRAAQMARGYERSWLVVPILVPVLHRIFARARWLGMSMDARGFDIEKIEL
jgi:energy-coupling factor transport system permease protein